MSLSLNCMASFTSTVKFHHVSRPYMGENYCLIWAKDANHKTDCLSTLFVQHASTKDRRWGRILAAPNSDTSTDAANIGPLNTRKTLVDDKFSAIKPVQSDSTSTNVETRASSEDETGKQDETSSNMQPTPKRSSPLTAREKLRAARVLSRFTESNPRNPEMGSNVLEALRDSEGGRTRSGLPKAPTDLFDDSKRGMPKQGLTFDLPGGTDLFIIIFSFVFISTVMFATTYIVWKAGAIHFNEY